MSSIQFTRPKPKLDYETATTEETVSCLSVMGPCTCRWAIVPSDYLVWCLTSPTVRQHNLVFVHLAAASSTHK